MYVYKIIYVLYYYRCFDNGTQTGAGGAGRGRSGARMRSSPSLCAFHRCVAVPAVLPGPIVGAKVVRIIVKLLRSVASQERATM